MDVQSCAPNCETQKWRDPVTNETRVGLFTTSDVPKGTELTYDYCFNHFGSSSALSFTCKCGARTCRGTLDANPERHKDYGCAALPGVIPPSPLPLCPSVRTASGSSRDADESRGNERACAVRRHVCVLGE